MSKFKTVMLFALVAITITLVWWFSPNQVIKRQTHTVVQCLDIRETATKTYRALKTNSFSNLLGNTVSCEVDIANYQSKFSRDRLIESHQIYAYNIDSAVAEASNVDVHIIDDTNASATADVNFAVRSKKASAASEKIELKLKWQKNDSGKWKLTEIKMIGALAADSKL